MTIFSGIQPSGTLHIGNYLGALKQFIPLQYQGDAFYCIVDLHAITNPQKPEELKKNTLAAAAMYLACGLDPEHATIFVQSHVSAHCELAWILNTIATMGELSRMTQFKEKSDIKGQMSDVSVGVGLFDYPVLMAADILLYNTQIVPVGEDQTQHVELARELAKRFNKRFGETFIIPKAQIQKSGARIMGLDDPTKKMSKSASSSLNYIALTDDADTIRKKISKAVTDSGTEIKHGSDKPAMANLLTIMSLLSDTTIPQLEKKYQGKTYAEFKKDLADVIILALDPIQRKYQELLNDQNHLEEMLKLGADRAKSVATETMGKVREKIGLLKNSN